MINVMCWPLSWVDHKILFIKKNCNWTIINTLTMCWCHATSCHHPYSMFWICDDMVVTQINHLNCFCGSCLQIDGNWMNEICDIDGNVLVVNWKFELQLKLVVIVSTCIIKN